jgi:small-conductance mechanosensitive channel
MIDSLLNAINAEVEQFFNFLPRLFVGLVVFILLYLMSKIIRRGNFPETYHAFFSKMVNGIFVLIGFIVFLNLIGYDTLVASLVASGGLTAVMLGFAFKVIGENFLTGFFLAFNRPLQLTI